MKRPTQPDLFAFAAKETPAPDLTPALAPHDFAASAAETDWTPVVGPRVDERDGWFEEFIRRTAAKGEAT